MNPEPRRLDFSDVTLYAVTPDAGDPAVIQAAVDKVLAGGVDAVQLRCRSLTDRALAALGRDLKRRCAAAGALFIMNNRADIAVAVDADGLHVGHEDLEVPIVREWIGHRKIIGVSTHSLPEALEAQRAGADYVSCGPLWATPTKPQYPAVGLGLIGLYRAALRVPFVAIGGINASNIDAVVAAGATRAAVVRALFEGDPAAQARFFKGKLLANRTETAV